MNFLRNSTYLQVLQGHEGAENSPGAKAVILALGDDVGLRGTAAHEVDQGAVEVEDGGAGVHVVLVVVSRGHWVLDGHDTLGLGSQALKGDALRHLREEMY